MKPSSENTSPRTVAALAPAFTLAKYAAMSALRLTRLLRAAAAAPGSMAGRGKTLSAYWSASVAALPVYIKYGSREDSGWLRSEVQRLAGGGSCGGGENETALSLDKMERLHVRLHVLPRLGSASHDVAQVQRRVHGAQAAGVTASSSRLRWQATQRLAGAGRCLATADASYGRVYADDTCPLHSGCALNGACAAIQRQLTITKPVEWGKSG